MWLMATAVGAFGVLMLPARWFPVCGSATFEGIETLEDAVAACQRTGLRDWELIAFAQRLVYRKFAYYSCRNLWDTPARAFRRGMGYCTQYNLALKAILERLGFETQAVFSLRVGVADRPDWSMGHTWLRVRLGSDVREVCAGHADNLPGVVHFTPSAPVWSGRWARAVLQPSWHDLVLRLPGVASGPYARACSELDVPGSNEHRGFKMKLTSLAGAGIADCSC